MINSIELENWKAHGRTAIHFSKGTNILVGQMGAGKTSILDAVSFALFGTFPAIKNRRVKVEDMIRSKPRQEQSARLKLEFDADGSTYSVERTISSGEPAKATLKKDGAYVQSQPQRVTEEIERALKMDYDLFARAVYSEQNRLDYFLELSSSERKKQVDNLLGLDRFAAAQENSASLVNRIKAMVEDAEKTAKNFDVDKLNEQRAQLAGELSKLADEARSSEESLRELSLAEETSAKELAKLKALLERKTRLEKEAGETRSRIAVLEKELSGIDKSGLPDPAELAKQASEAEARISLLRKSASDLSESMQSAQARLGRLNAEQADAERRKKEKAKIVSSTNGISEAQLSASLESERKGLDAITQEHAKIQAEKGDAEKSLKELRTHIAKCPVCDSTLTKEKRESLMASREQLISRAESSISALARSRAEKSYGIAKLEKDLNGLSLALSRIKDLGDPDAQIARIASEIGNVSGLLANAKAQYSRANESLSTETEMLSRLRLSKERSERAHKHLSDIEKYSAALKEKEKELGGIGVSGNAVEELQKRHTRLSADKAERSAVLAASRKAHSEKKAQLHDKDEELHRVKAIFDELKVKKLSIDDLSRFRNSLAETQSVLRKRLVSSINSIMQGIWPELYPYGDYTGIMLTASDSDYELQLRSVRNSEQAWESVNSVASGGERSIACMAMRIAFSLVLVPNLRWLILDEPTHNIDREGLSKFVRLLNESLPNIVEQIFVITHDEQLKSVSNGRIYLLSRNKAEYGGAAVQEL